MKSLLQMKPIDTSTASLPARGDLHLVAAEVSQRSPLFFVYTASQAGHRSHHMHPRAAPNPDANFELGLLDANAGTFGASE